MQNKYHLTITEWRDKYVLWFIHDDKHFYIRDFDRNVAIKLWANWVESHTFVGKISRCYGGEFQSLEPKILFTHLEDALQVKLAFVSKDFE